MNNLQQQSETFERELDEAIQIATSSIAPSWPLDKMIAVNPYWPHLEQTFSETSHHLATLAGSPMAMPLFYYQHLWSEGKITKRHLQQAVQELNTELTIEQLINALNGDDQLLTPVPLLCDTLDSQRDLQHKPAWCDAITHQVAQFCAAYFDKDQSDWNPSDPAPLYASWCHTLSDDHSISLLMQASRIPRAARQLEENPRKQIEIALLKLDIPKQNWADYLQAVMYRISGWAAWCAYLKWQAQLQGNDDDNLLQLLAIRLTWEMLIDDGEREEGSIWHLWQTQWQGHFENYNAQHTTTKLVWQRAQEISYQQELAKTLQQYSASNNQQSQAVKIQAAFCIDVRSEVFRRHLENQSDDIETIGFAGFFGLPVSYHPLGTNAVRPQLPGLLAPQMVVTDTSGSASVDEVISRQRQTTLRSLSSWKSFLSLPGSAFNMVESLGISYVNTLLNRSRARNTHQAKPALGLNQRQVQQLRPHLQAELSQRIELAEGVLRGMGLTQNIAPVVLLVGHGSQTANNPQKAGLDCGACCGQTGEVNARALADILNDPEVRKGLHEKGLKLPEDTRFIAALHNTTTDQVSLFDADNLSAKAQEVLPTLKDALSEAGKACRAERAPGLGLGKLTQKPAALQKAVIKRANDWAQTRPEWGLANNACFIVGRRSLTRNLDFKGRSFLHEYDASQDTDASLLTQIMTAPMVVINWINMQYFASTVDNHRYGSGNKTLHNVVGGRIGVFEGNGGDLRIGLAMQSVHDGQQWRHEPLRTTVVIDAPQEHIEKVINEQPLVASLINNQWMHLARFDKGQLYFYNQGSWQAQSFSDDDPQAK